MSTFLDFFEKHKTFGFGAQDGEQLEVYPQNSSIISLKIFSVDNFVLIPSHLRLSNFENALSLSHSHTHTHTHTHTHIFLNYNFFIEHLGIFVK